MVVFEVELIYRQPYKPDNDYISLHAHFLMGLRVEELVEKTKHSIGIKEIIEFKYKDIDTEKQKQEIEQIMQHDPYIIYGIADFKINTYALLDYPVELSVFENPVFLFFKFAHNLLSRTMSEALNAETGEKIQVAKELPAKIAGVTGREYLLKSSALLCEKMNAMLQVSCYENWLAVAYLGSGEFKKTLEDTRANLYHSVSSLDDTLQAYERRKAQLDETENIKFKKEALECVTKIKTHLDYVKNTERKNSAVSVCLTTAHVKVDKQSISGFIKTLAEGFSGLVSAIPIELLVMIEDYANPPDLMAYIEKLNELHKIFETTWRLLELYKRAVDSPKHRDFSDLSLIVRYTGNFRSVEDSIKNAVMVYTPGNRCIDPLMQFSLNAINYYSKNFCQVHDKNRDEFRNIFIDAYVAMVNAKRNHKNTLSRIHHYLFVTLEKDKPLEAESLIQVLILEKEIETKSIQKFKLFQTWMRVELNKLKTNLKTSSNESAYPNFQYHKPDESSMGNTILNRRNAKVKANTKIQTGKIGTLRVVTSNTTLEITNLFEDMISCINNYLELHQSYFHLIDLVQKLSTHSPIVLSKMNELFCLSHRTFLIGDKQLLEILVSDKPLDIIEKLKKEVHSKIKILIDKPNQPSTSQSLSAKAFNWMRERFLTSGNVTPLSDRQLDKSAHDNQSQATNKGTLLSPPLSSRRVPLLNIPVTTIGSLPAAAESNEKPQSTPNTVL